MSGDGVPGTTVLYERPLSSVARIVMNRPEARNAQNVTMLYELNRAFDRAAQDDDVRAIIVAAAEPHFCAGHDLRSVEPIGGNHPLVGTWAGFNELGVASRVAREQEIYLGLTRRWRDLPKPTIAAVQGHCIGGGLMLAWACDIILASDDAIFRDPVVAMGVCGVEYFAHPWELGPRKAKELLFTAETWTAADAERFGMVNHVVPRERLASFALDLAERISKKPMFALRMAKQAVNQSVDIGGQRAALDAAFSLHQLCHAHNMSVFGQPMDPSGVPAALVKGAKK